MSSYFFKILIISVAILVIVEKVQAENKVQAETKVTKSNTKVENESKNINKGLQCDNSDGWKNLDANHSTTDCNDGKCFGAWLIGDYRKFASSNMSCLEPFSDCL